MKNINQLIHYIGYLIFLGILVFCSLLISGKISFEKDFGIGKISINERILTGTSLGNFKPETGNNYTFILKQEKTAGNDVSDRLSFIAILTTLLAAFFVYSSWKIDKDLSKIDSYRQDIKSIKESADDDLEYSNQLKYAVHYMMSKQYDKAIDALVMLRSETFTLKNNGNLNSCNYFLAVCWYEKGNLSNNLEDISRALQYVDEAIEDDTHPLKIEISNKLEELKNK